MLTYLYTSEYSDSQKREDKSCAAVFNVKVFRLARRYEVDSLMELAKTKFAKAISEKWHTKDFVTAIDQCFTGSECAPLHPPILNTVMEHVMSLYIKAEYKEFRLLAAEIPELTSDVVVRVVDRLRDMMLVQIYGCPTKKCRKLFRAAMGSEKTFRYTCESCERIYNLLGKQWNAYKVDAPLRKSVVDNDR